MQKCPLYKYIFLFHMDIINTLTLLICFIGKAAFTEKAALFVGRIKRKTVKS